MPAGDVARRGSVRLLFFPQQQCSTAMKCNRVFAVLGIVVALGLVATGVIRFRFERDLAVAAGRAASGSKVVATRCGPIEVQQAGVGIPLLMIHGSGGHDQGMAWARPLTQQGVRVVAMSRFGYLRTPRPADASPEKQA